MINRLRLIPILAVLMINCNQSTTREGLVSDELKQESIVTLQQVLHQQQEWIKVHAAEFLIWSGNPLDVQQVYLAELEKFETKSPYRIGIWRVLAQAASTDEERKKWTDKILAAFLDETGPDRLHAVETLAKLGISPLLVNEPLTRAAMQSEQKSLALYTQWSAAYTSDEMRDSVRTAMVEVVLSPEEEKPAKNQAAYVLRQLGGLRPEQWMTLANTELQVPETQMNNLNLLSALFQQVPEQLVTSDTAKKIHERLRSFSKSASKGERSELAMALAKNGTKEDVDVLVEMLHNAHPLSKEDDNEDVKAAAAYGLLMIGKR